MLAVYINSALPQPVKIPCVVAGERSQDDMRVAQMRFSGLSEAVVEQLDKLIFPASSATRGRTRGSRRSYDPPIVE